MGDNSTYMIVNFLSIRLRIQSHLTNDTGTSNLIKCFLLRGGNSHQRQCFSVQVVDVVLAVPELCCDLLPAHECKISHLKDGLTLHAVGVPSVYVRDTVFLNPGDHQAE